MLGSVVLDVAIGMVFVYLLLSLIASAILEIFAALVQTRSANLQRGIRSLFSEDSIQDGITLAESVYKHGLTRGLYQDPHRDYGEATGLIDRLRLKLQTVFGIAPPKEIEGIRNPLLLPAYIPSRTFALALIDILAKNNDNGQGTMQRITGFLNGHHAAFQDNKAVEALLTLIENSENKIEKFQANLENWYNDAMDRVSGWYKKYSQNVLLVIGLALAVGFNVNSIQVARTLWFDRDARQEMVDAATAYLDNNKTAPAPPTALPANANAASPSSAAPAANAANDGASPTPAPAPANAGAAAASSTPVAPAATAANVAASSTPAPAPAPSFDPGVLQQNMTASVNAFKSVTTAALLPVGWSGTREEIREREFGTWLIGFGTVAGWLITAVALSLGAPFWFDTLNKFMVVRSTIKPQEKSLPEASKS